MALIAFGISTCALCREVRREDQGPVGFPAYHLGDPALDSLNEAGVHPRCFLAWPLRTKFVEAFNASMLHFPHRTGTMRADGRIASAGGNSEPRSTISGLRPGDPETDSPCPARGRRRESFFRGEAPGPNGRSLGTAFASSGRGSFRTNNGAGRQGWQGCPSSTAAGASRAASPARESAPSS